MATKIAYAIARESSGDKTLAVQFADLRQAAKDLGYEIVLEFGENISGNIAKYDYANPKFIENLQIAINQKKPDAIFCVSMDRITRTPVMQGKYLMDFSVIPQIPIYFTRYKRWTIDPETKVVDEDWIDELASDKSPKKERLNIVARTAPQREKNGAEGYYIGHLSDGYCVKESWGTYEDGQRRKIKKIIIDEERRGVIEDIFQWYRNGYSVGKIADLLNSTNVPTTNGYRASTPEKFGHRQKYKGKDGVERERIKSKWNGSLVSQILSNTWYKGIRKYRGKTLTHNAIIPVEEWDEVAAMREERKLSFRSKKEATKHIFLLSDLFYCGQCGRKMYGHYPGLNNHYYCSSKELKMNCGLTGINKENVEAIIYDIISNKALKAVVEGTGDFIITDFFQINKKKEKEIKETIANNNKIISNLESDNDTLDKKRDHLVDLRSECYDNPEMDAVYAAKISKINASKEDNKTKIVKLQIENKDLNHLLSANSNIKDILRNIIDDKELSLIRQLFKQAIEKVILFNARKRDDVIRIKFRNGKQAEFVYCARLLGNNYILLEEPLHYDEKKHLIVSSSNPTYIVIDNNYYVFFRNKGSNIESERNLYPSLSINETTSINIDNGITIKDFIKMVKDTNMVIPFERLEEEPEIAKKQREHYQHWRRKYNTGMPKGIEPYILHNETYEKIQVLRNRLYKKTYKIKMRKTLSDEEKEAKISEIKRQLDALTVQVPLIKPRKKRTSKKHDDEELRKAFEEPAE